MVTAMCIRLLWAFLGIYIIASSAVDASSSRVKVGIDVLMHQENVGALKSKHIGLITNHTAINGKWMTTTNVFKVHEAAHGYKLVALFAPEHGIDGAAYADEWIGDAKDADGIPIYSLHGKTRRLTDEMLKQVDLLIFDIQDVGSRSYTYISTLFYAMEEAAKHHIPFMVLDRPNPINGITIDGPVLENRWRSFLGYINIPFCHGMTVGELARYFNEEYQIGCKLDVIPMEGWHRRMSFQDTGLPWIPTSPYIPEATTPLFYPMTGLLGELKMVNIGIGYTLPFKVVGAPWIDARMFADSLNAQKFPGVRFEPFHYRPFYGRFAQQSCHGVLIIVTNPAAYLPVTTQYLMIGILKGLYPQKFAEAMAAANVQKDTICYVSGTEEIYRLMNEEKNIVWKLRNVHRQKREDFVRLRKKYLIPSYLEPV